MPRSSQKTVKTEKLKRAPSASNSINVAGASQNNLKNISFALPTGEFTVVTGPSGSGKSSLAFDTLYAEGQRRYAETFSPYTRQFLERMDKPRVDHIDGIPPAIALSQANSVRTSRSTVGTMTEIADYLKLLMARKAILISPTSGKELRPWKPDELAEFLIEQHSGTNLLIGVSIPFNKKTTWASMVATLAKQGVVRHIDAETLNRLNEKAPPSQQTIGKQDVIHGVLTRVKATREAKSRLQEALSQGFDLGSGTLFVASESDLSNLHRYSNSWECPDSSQTFTPPTPSLFSFNSPVGACPECRGFGRTIEIDYDLALPDRNLSVADGVVKPFQTESNAVCQEDLERACKRKKIPLDVPFYKLSKSHQQFIVKGEPGKGYENRWYGVRGFFDWLETKTYKVHVRVLLARYRAYSTCSSCSGSHFQSEVSNWQLDGKTLPEINELALKDLKQFVNSFKASDKSEKILIDQIKSRVNYLNQVGLGYLTLNRSTRTLSGGEIQRVNLTTCLGSSLVGTLFVLDEPSIGLHPRDTSQLIETLRKLTSRGNTTLVVEHDEQFMEEADNLLELGPGRGDAGGDLIYLGPSEGITKEKESLTGNYLSGKKEIPLPSISRPITKSHPWLEFTGAAKNNIQNLDVRFPLRRFCAITGVSGSGKSTLLHDIVYKHIQLHLKRPVESPGTIQSLKGAKSIKEVHIVDQSPLTKTPRSTPLLYLGCYDDVRNLFSQTEEAQRRGLRASSFSFNSGDGRCGRCQGTGFEKISMQFLSDLFVTCPVCEGKRFQKHVLEVQWYGKNIHDVLSLTVEESLRFFDPKNHQDSDKKSCQNIVDQMQLLNDVGLGYLRLGQPLNQLSGGESQRIKLVSHLTHATQKASTSSKEKDSDTVLILDEPTTGLHFDDIAVLLKVLHRIVDAGMSLFVIEHNLDLIKNADYVVDLGPEAGDGGGEVVAFGTPEKIARTTGSITGKFLKRYFAPPKTRTKVSSKQASKKKLPSKKDATTLAIQVNGARHHNLKNISVEIPRDQMVVVTGLSGSGKSTLAFDLLFAEGQRRYLDCLNTYARQFVEQLEKPDVDAILGLPPTVAIEQRTTRGGAKSTVATVTELYHFLRLLYAKLGIQHDPETGEPAVRQSADEIVNRIKKNLKSDEIALLAPLVKQRKGIYTELGRWAVRKDLPYLRVDGEWIHPSEFEPLDRYKEHSIDAVLGNLDSDTKQLEVLVNYALELGKGTIYTIDNQSKESIYSTELFCPGSGRSFDALDPRLFSFNSPYGWCPTCNGYGTIAKVSVDPNLNEAEREAALEEAREESEETIPCPDCNMSRLNPIARAVRFQGRPIPEWNALSVEQFEKEFAKIKLNKRESEIARDILPEIQQRLKFLKHVGLGYLQLDRAAPTLSGGESQRIRLAAQLGSNLQGVLYILDEPTIGLHPRDNEQLLEILDALKNRGNSLVVVEHDEDTMKQADQVIDLGPGAGINGGKVVAQGHWKAISKNGNGRSSASNRSSTASFLGEPMAHPLKGSWRSVPKNHPVIEIKGAHANNLKNIDVKLPKNRLIVFSGVSGSGKSTLMHEVIRPAVDASMQSKQNRKAQSTKKPKTKSSKPVTEQAWLDISGASDFDRVLEIDQSPIGKTSRSTVATYIGLMDHLRALFASLPLAKARGFDKSYFSYNAGKGRCPACQGQGSIKVEMNFLPATYVPCDQCQGKRWTHSLLEVEYHGHSIFDILSLSVDEALPFFEKHPKVAVPLKLLQETGLGYLKIGQTSPTLSGGEAQRLKLVAELAIAEQARQKHILKSSNPKLPQNLYLLEEPTVGLHLADVKKLIELMHRLVDSGHTVIVIEHHLDVIAEADWILDIGPEGGLQGGQLVAQGTPKTLVKSKKSHTAPFLEAVL
ncbi:MAG: excinuclease ABC subunit UvrA [Verrucomicrobiota bacterium]